LNAHVFVAAIREPRSGGHQIISDRSVAAIVEVCTSMRSMCAWMRSYRFLKSSRDDSAITSKWRRSSSKRRSTASKRFFDPVLESFETLLDLIDAL